MTTQRTKVITRQSRHTRRATARSADRRWGDSARRIQTRAEPSLRARVASAFRELGKGVDEKTTYEQTKKFFRSGGTEWARRLY